MDERGVARERRASKERRVSMDLRASSDWRGYVSWTLSVIGERAEMSNDLRYESKLSREMLKGSFSARRLRWFDEVVETLDLVCQNVGFSWCGEGGKYTPLSLISLNLYSAGSFSFKGVAPETVAVLKSFSGAFRWASSAWSGAPARRKGLRIGMAVGQCRQKRAVQRQSGVS